jgi:hypothetical protein
MPGIRGIRRPGGERGVIDAGRYFFYMTGRVSAIDIQGGMMLKLKKLALLSVLPLVLGAAHNAQAQDKSIICKYDVDAGDKSLPWMSCAGNDPQSSNLEHDKGDIYMFTRRTLLTSGGPK